MKTVTGIDEVGRGPLAGPVVVCALRLKTKSQFFKEKSIFDSKKLSAEKRNTLYSKILEEKLRGNIDFATAFVGAKTIDKENISVALKKGVERALKKIGADTKEAIFLDGSLYAPKKFTNQKTIIKGDEKEKAIALSSIVAKVERDRKMIKLADRYPRYGLERHKGYGTKEHMEQILKYGLSPIHRYTYCKNLLSQKKAPLE